jgi:hypothetical protein
MVNSVVASVAMPADWSILHALRPSQVLGILMHTRVVSNVESKCLNICTTPVETVSNI